jgi:hypothetical protein
MKRLFALAALLAVTGLGVGVGCGREADPSRDEFSDRLQSIGQQGGELWGRLAQRARDLKADEPLPTPVKQPMRELVEFQLKTAAELSELNPPSGAEDEVEMLIAALRVRTKAFDETLEVGHFTRPQSDEITRSGERIDEAFQRLRDEGFLPMADEHEGE